MFLVAQWCLTLCDPMDCSPLGTSYHGIFQARNWSGLPFPAPGEPSNSGIKPMSPALAGRFFTTEPPGKPQLQFLLIIYPFTHSSIHLTSAKPCPGNRMEDQLDKRLCIITIFAFTLENSVSPLLYFLPRPFLCSLKNLCSFTCIAKGACPPHYLCPNPLLSSVQSLSHV